MLNIQIGFESGVPVYEQIVEQVKLLIGMEQLKPGDKMPAVRQLSRQLGINPTTVSHAYRKLKGEGVLEAKSRRGTVVVLQPDRVKAAVLRQSHLTGRAYEFVLKALSLGYSPDELESEFKNQLEKRTTPQSQILPTANLHNKSKKRTINIIGSNDLALDLLVSRFKYKHSELLFHTVPVGSTGGLLAILEGKADIAGTHLLDVNTGQYNYPFIKHTIQGMEVVVVHLVDRIQGLIIAKGNPKHIKGLGDLRRPDIVFVNRQKGSGTRVLTDYKLREAGIGPNEVRGYDIEMSTHLEVALSVAGGKADAGIGIQSAANSCDLEFIPIAKEKFDLVIPMDNYQTPVFLDLVKMIRSEEYKRSVSEMGGYDTARTGEVEFVNIINSLR